MSDRPPVVTWKTKYFPSGVQLPQQRLIGPSDGPAFGLSAGRGGRSGWRSVPSRETSQIELAEVGSSKTVNRTRVPSGDQRGCYPRPGNVTSNLGSLPSLLARYKSLPRAYTISRPSGDHEPSQAEASPSR